MIRVPDSSGRYPRPTWEGTVQFAGRDGSRLLYRQRFQVSAKTSDTAIARIVRAGRRAAGLRIRAATVTTVSNLRRINP